MFEQIGSEITRDECEVWTSTFYIKHCPAKNDWQKNWLIEVALLARDDYYGASGPEGMRDELLWAEEAVMKRLLSLRVHKYFY